MGLFCKSCRRIDRNLALPEVSSRRGQPSRRVSLISRISDFLYVSLSLFLLIFQGENREEQRRGDKNDDVEI